MTLRKLIVRLLPADTRLGHSLRRHYRRLRPASIVEWQHEVLHAFAQSYPRVRFVQIGSNDAGYADPLRYYILHRGWRGLMIEALPYIYKRLKYRYRDMPGLKFANVAITSEAGKQPFYHLRPSDEPGLPPWYDMLGSFSKEHVLAHQKYMADIPERIVATQVDCATLAQVCEQQGIEQFEVLHIDAEGYDYRILSTIDVSACGLLVVLFENRHLSEQEYAAALAQLHAADFVTHSDPFDTIGVHRQAIEAKPDLARAWRRLRRFHNEPFLAQHSGEREAEATR